MDKDNFKKEQSTNNQKKSFFKRDGFYVVLFVCLCVVAGVVTYVNTTPKQKTSSLIKQESGVSNANNSKATNAKGDKTTAAKESKTKKNEVDNANLVKKETVKTPAKASVPTSAPVTTSMVKPVNGTIALGYTGTDGSMSVGLDNVSRTILGEYLKVSSRGVPVYAAMSGTVLSVDGGRVTIGSKDGKLKTIYDNLEAASVTLKVNDEVAQNSKIGTIGDSDNAKDRIVDCDHLYFEIDEKQSDGSYKDVNPQNFVKY